MFNHIALVSLLENVPYLDRPQTFFMNRMTIGDRPRLIEIQIKWTAYR